MRNAAGALADYTPIKGIDKHCLPQLSLISYFCSLSVVGGFREGADSSPEATEKVVEMDSNFFFHRAVSSLVK